MTATLRVTEIFHSLQGESNTTGLPTVFIRLTGCPLRCGYCDTAYAFTGGEVRTIHRILADAGRWRCRRVLVTGGEPLAQPACIDLLRRLCDLGYQTSLETSGALDVSAVDPRVVKVLDLKTPGSGECARNRYENLRHLGSRDQVKFVICDRADYEWSRNAIEQLDLRRTGCELLFSPAHGRLAAPDLAGWILEDELDVRFQIQLHKHLWGDRPGV
jgi:7-carboxy-7-deazaguanine synthase